MALTPEKLQEIDEAWNSYFYPGTQTLKNKYNITDYDELKEKEAEISFEKLVELYDNPIVGDFDAEHLRNIHKYIFGDLYEWAGEYRYVDMRKQTDFTKWENIPEYLNGELKLMHEEIKNVTDKRSLAIFLSTYYIQLMAIHPFREGNGRSSREFLRELVETKTKEMPCGPLELDWTKFNGDVVLDNIQLALVFRSAIDNEFFNALVPIEIEDNLESAKKM